MADMIIPHNTNLINAINATRITHLAIREGIATHAQKHEHEIDARRNEAVQQERIRDGIKRANS